MLDCFVYNHLSHLSHCSHHLHPSPTLIRSTRWCIIHYSTRSLNDVRFISEIDPSVISFADEETSIVDRSAMTSDPIPLNANFKSSVRTSSKGFPCSSLETVTYIITCSELENFVEISSWYFVALCFDPCLIMFWPLLVCVPLRFLLHNSTEDLGYRYLKNIYVLHQNINSLRSKTAK